jgi:hypothetical protein
METWLVSQHKSFGGLAGNAGSLGKHNDQTVGIVCGDAMLNSMRNKNNAARFYRDIITVLEGYLPVTFDNIENFVLQGVLMKHRMLAWLITNYFTHGALGLKDFFANTGFVGKLGEVGNFVNLDVFG